MLETRDGLKMSLMGGAVASLKVNGRELALGGPSGFLVRDAAAGSGAMSVYPLAAVWDESTGIALASVVQPRPRSVQEVHSSGQTGGKGRLAADNERDIEQREHPR